MPSGHVLGEEELTFLNIGNMTKGLMLKGCQISFKILILKPSKPMFDQYIIASFSLLCLLKVLAKQASTLFCNFILRIVDSDFM